MKPIVLFRGSLAETGELEIARKYFSVYEHRTLCQKNDFVICRYSYLPYAKELEDDLISLGCKIINSYSQHRWVANFDYYEEVKKYTPETWFDDNFYMAKEGKYIVKGRTNSRKHQWKTKMLSNNKSDALRIASELLNDDPMIGEQGIIFRKYIPLKTYEIGMNGLPFTDEYRFFFYKTKELCHGYYWGIAENTSHKISEEGIKFAHKLAEKVARHVNFFVLDVAQTESGEWILIEINDGQQSGLSLCDPDELYFNLKKELESV